VCLCSEIIKCTWLGFNASRRRLRQFVQKLSINNISFFRRSAAKKLKVRESQSLALIIFSNIRASPVSPKALSCLRNLTRFHSYSVLGRSDSSFLDRLRWRFLNWGKSIYYRRDTCQSIKLTEHSGVVG
jgi:hypothetical protein